MSALVFRRSGELIRTQAVVFVLLALWASAPVAELLLHVARHGGVLTGAYGYDPYDQLAYLAWIRDEGNHILASNLWSIAPTPHDYLHPMYLISGLLWRAGASVQLAYLVWTPVGLLVLFLGFAAYVRHQLGDSRRAQVAALVLASFYETPLLAVAHWTSLLSGGHELQLLLASDDAYSALNLWGFEHTAIAIGLMPVFLIATERLLASWGDERARTRGWSVLAAASGAGVSWLHPWQGLTLLVIVGVLFIARPPRRRFLALAVPVAATVLPLVYGVVLARADPSWVAFQARTMRTGTAAWWALLGSFGPLGVFALLGLSTPRDDRDWMLLLWPLACAFVYFVIPEDPPHALSGITLPLAILAVRGWRRLRIPRAIAAPAAVAAIAAVTVPAAIYQAKSVRDNFTNPTRAALLQLQVLPPGEAEALTFIGRSHRPGGVLAPQFMSMSVPGLTGHPTYWCHVMWQPIANSSLAAAFFDPALKDPTGTFRQGLLLRSRVAYVIAEC